MSLLEKWKTPWPGFRKGMSGITCEYCHTFPHRIGCPAGDDSGIKVCGFCGREIRDDEVYIEIDEMRFHAECGISEDE